MIKEERQIGYIEAVFQEDEKQKVVDWVNSIKKEDLFTAIINGKVEGGNIANKLHLTLYYGFNEYLLNKDDLFHYIESMIPKTVDIIGLGTFPIKGYDCKVLFLKVSDTENILRKIHNDLGKYSHFVEYQQEEYVPHISIAYVKKDFDLNSLIYGGPKRLSIKEILYHSKFI